MNVPGPERAGENDPEGAPGVSAERALRLQELPYSCNCGHREFTLRVPRGKNIARIFCAKCRTEFGIGFKCP